jgi:type IV pilus assembly protein PilA
VHARAFNGDTAYAIDSDVPNVLYSVSNPTWPGENGLMATAQTPTDDADDFDGGAVSGGGMPTDSWLRAD